MDVASGATNVSFSRKFIDKFIGRLLVFGVTLLLQSYSAFALGENQPIHFSADKQIWNRKVNRVELIGHGAVNQLGETLTADYIILDLNSRLLDARGNCIYIAADSVIRGEEMHFNLETRTGTVIGGRVSNESFSLRGERIYKLGPGHFQTTQGEYSTCRDCSASWSLQAGSVDMEVNGYAYLSNVTARIKDVPAFWLPYMIVPMKTRRQSGFLFPSFAFSGLNGATFVLPYFWEISRSADMTFGLGEYTQRGERAELEGRYALSPRSAAVANLYYVSDRTFDISPRWALNIIQSQELFFGIEQKLKLIEMSDNLYPFHFDADVPSVAGEAFAASSLAFSRGSSDVSAYLSFHRYRNLLNSSPGNTRLQLTQFDPKTVQTYPSALVTTNDKFLGNTSFLGGLTVGFTNFTRTGGPFDPDYGTSPDGNAPFRPGIDPIRQATRLSLTPTIYTTLRPFDIISVVPSLQYRQYFYNFSNLVPNLYRGYLLFQTDLSAQLERIYEFPDDPTIPRAKHLIRPTLTYSYIPFIREDLGHPFLAQIKNAQDRKISGYNFDDNDIVPYTYTQSSANYFTPLGHSLAYGFTTQWIRRRGILNGDAPTYQNTVEFSSGQAINFLELSKSVDPHVFTRLYSVLNLNFDRFNLQSNYYYYPDIFPTTSRHTISSNLTYILERGFRQRILTYDRSFTLGYAYNRINGITSSLAGTLNFSTSDYILPFGSFEYSFEPAGKLISAGVGVQIQSPSRCWKLSTGVNYRSGMGISLSGLDLSLNLTGSGFGGVSQIASQVQSSAR